MCILAYIYKYTLSRLLSGFHGNQQRSKLQIRSLTTAGDLLLVLAVENYRLNYFVRYFLLCTILEIFTTLWIGLLSNPSLKTIPGHCFGRKYIEFSTQKNVL